VPRKKSEEERIREMRAYGAVPEMGVRAELCRGGSGRVLRIGRGWVELNSVGGCPISWIQVELSISLSDDGLGWVVRVSKVR
jgi:hypothetical protein